MEIPTGVQTDLAQCASMGRALYVLYLTAFGGVFAPKWEDLSAESQTQWEQLAVWYGQLVAQSIVASAPVQQPQHVK